MLGQTYSDKFAHISNANELCGILLEHNVTREREYIMRGEKVGQCFILLEITGL